MSGKESGNETWSSMPPKKQRRVEGGGEGKGSQKISTFFEPKRRSPRKRPRGEEMSGPATPPAKRSPTPTLGLRLEPAGLSPEPREPASLSPEPREPAGLSPEPREPAGLSPKQREPAGLSPEQREPAGLSPEQREPAGLSPEQREPASLSPEQRELVEKKRKEAEVKRVRRQLGTERVGASWINALLPEFKKPYMMRLMDFLKVERQKNTIYPPLEDVFSWTVACDIDEVKVVIIGQDPYHGPNQAHGLCFSVRVGVAAPPSLQNMYKELQSDIDGFTVPDHGFLIGWAKQGVLLLNACLTVRAREANSHKGKGWEKLTDAVIHWLNDHASHLVFLLWGAYAQKKGAFIDKKKHCVLTSVHPSPLSAHRGFLGSKHFSKANSYLRECGRSAIDWTHLPKTEKP